MLTFCSSVNQEISDLAIKLLTSLFTPQALQLNLITLTPEYPECVIGSTEGIDLTQVGS